MRTAWRALVVASAVPLSLLVTSPAFASAHHSDGEDPGSGMDLGTALLVFVGLPALVILVIWLLAAAPSIARGPRYRPGLSWWATPEWFNGPDWFGGPREEESMAAVTPQDATLAGGGSSARW